MEEMNNLNNQPVIPVIETPPKKNNTFKLLFIISILIVIGLVIFILFLIKNPKQTTIVGTNNQTEETVTPTVAEKIISQQTIPTVVKDKKYEAVSIQDDKNSITKLVLKDNQGGETIISESKYWKLTDDPNGLTAKPNNTSFMFSLDNNFLYYFHSSGYEVTTSFLYDIKNKKNIDLGFSVYDDNPAIFTSDSKYFYGCSEGGMMNGGAIIVDLTKSLTIYKKEGSFNCKYNTNDNSLSITDDTFVSGEKKTKLFSFTTGNFVN